jgi:hypothetical protein
MGNHKYKIIVIGLLYFILVGAGALFIRNNPEIENYFPNNTPTQKENLIVSKQHTEGHFQTILKKNQMITIYTADVWSVTVIKNNSEKIIEVDKKTFLETVVGDTFGGYPEPKWIPVNAQISNN